MSDQDREEEVLARDPEFVQGRADADAALAAGRTEPLSKVLDELDSEAGR